MVAFFLFFWFSRRMFSGFSFRKVFFHFWVKVKKSINLKYNLFWWSPKNLHSVSAFFMFFALRKTMFSHWFWWVSLGYQKRPLFKFKHFSMSRHRKCHFLKTHIFHQKVIYNYETHCMLNLMKITLSRKHHASHPKSQCDGNHRNYEMYSKNL